MPIPSAKPILQLNRVRFRLLLIALLLNLSATGQLHLKRGYWFNRTNMSKLARQITKNAETDSQKVAQIHYWITHHIKYDAKRYVKGRTEGQDSRKVLWRRKTLCSGYSNLFHSLCKESNVRSIVVNGYTKNNLVDIGDTTYLPDHAWNLANFNGTWNSIDNTWDAGYVRFFKTGPIRAFFSGITFGLIRPYKYKPHFVKAPSDFYFAMPPNDFAVDHLAENPGLQDFNPQLNTPGFDADSTCYYLEEVRRVQLATFDNSFPDFYVNLDDVQKAKDDARSASRINSKNRFGDERYHTYIALDAWNRYKENEEVLSQDSAYLKAMIVRADSALAAAGDADSLNWQEYRGLRERWKEKRRIQRAYSNDFLGYLRGVNYFKKVNHRRIKGKISKEGNRMGLIRSKYSRTRFSLIRNPGRYPRRANEARANRNAQSFEQYNDSLDAIRQQTSVFMQSIRDSVAQLTNSLYQKSAYISEIGSHFFTLAQLRFAAVDDFDMLIAEQKKGFKPHASTDSTFRTREHYIEVYNLLDSLYKLSKQGYSIIKKQKTKLRGIKRSTHRRHLYHLYRGRFTKNLSDAKSTEVNAGRFRKKQLKILRKLNKRTCRTSISMGWIRLEMRISLPTSLLRSKRNKNAKDIKNYKRISKRIRNKTRTKLNRLRERDKVR